MKIKISTFKSRLQHSLEFKQEIEHFLKSVEKELDDSLILSELEDYDCDLKLIFIQTGGSEGLFLENFAKLKEPYYLLTNGGNNSLAASLEILSYLNTQNKKGEILHGSINYIVTRIKELAQLERAKKILNKTKLGVVGNPSDWLISSVPNYKLIQEKMGLELIDIPLSIVEEKALRPHFSNLKTSDYKKFNMSDLNTSINIFDGLNEIIKEQKLSGVTIRCFDLLKSLKGTGCLALAELNKNGCIGTCEGDIMAMISMQIVQALTGQSSFQANPSRINVENNSIVFAHCTLPFDMVDDYQLDTHFESGIGVAIKGELKTGKVTVFRMSSDLKHYFVSGGILMNNLNESNLCRTQVNIRLDKPVTELLKAPCGNHHIIFYGDYEKLIQQFMDILLK
jgi:L-fucose isomerase and related proteins